MAKSLEVWKNSVLGKQIDLDNQSYDCVDVSKSWVEYLTDVGWQTSAGWGNAKDIYSFWSDKYLEKMPAGTAPQLGDIAVMDGSIGGGFGHTGVVIAINGRNITLAQQNTFTQQAVYTGIWNGYGSYIKYMRPKVAFVTGDAPAVQPNQRVVGGEGVNHRDAPNRTAHVRQLWGAGEVLTLGGFVRGENVDGNDIWFVGGLTGGYLHSSGFTDMSTHDLSDITPAAALAGNQRQVARDVMNYRRTPELKPDNVIKTFNPGEVLDFDGFVHGSAVEGNDIWFRGKYTGGFVHSSGFTDTGTHDLPDVTSTPTTPTPEPAPVDLTTKVIDISSNNTVSDPAAVKKAVRAIVLKAGHTGISYGGLQPLNSDPTYAQRIGQFGDKVCGAYWYGYASLDAETEANAFLSTVGDVVATFSLWLDIEELDGKTVDEVNKWCQKFLSVVEEATKRKCGLYMNRNYFDTVITAETKAERPIWLAHYGTTEFSNPVKNQVAHQYTSDGAVVGMAGRTDISAVKPGFFITAPVEPTPTPEPTPDPTPETPKKDYQASVVRTVTPYIVGFIVAILAKQGITGSPEFVANITAIITFLVGSGYYAIVRWLETKYPKAGLLLGSAKKPVYVEPTSDQK